MPKQDPEAHMSLGDHLEELRRRVVVALLGLVPIVVLAFVFGQKMLAFIIEPVMEALAAHGDARQMILTGPTEGFAVYMKVALLASVIVGAPWIVLQLWRFVSPGLYAHERRFAYFLIPLSTVLTVLGVLFLYFYLMPLILKFFLDFNASLGTGAVPTAALPEGVTPGMVPILAADPPASALRPGAAWVNTSQNLLRICVSVNDGVPTIASASLKTTVAGASEVRSEIRISEYFSLLLSLTIAFAVAFQAPVVVLLLGWARIINQKVLGKYRRHAVLVCAIVAAAIAPGDPASMVMLMVSLYLLYELGGILLRLFPASRVAGARTRSRWGGDEEEYPDDLAEGPR